MSNSSFFYLLILALLSGVYLILSYESFSMALGCFCIFIVGITTFSFFKYQQSSSLKGHWDKPSNIFLLGLIVVYYQNILDLVLGYKTVSDFFCPDLLNHMIIISTLGLIAFHIGYNKKMKQTSPYKKSAWDITPNKTILLILQIGFFVGFVSNINIMFFLSGRDVIDGSSSIAQDIEYAYQATNIAMLISICIKDKNIDGIKDFLSKIPKMSLLILFLYLILRLFSGDRGPVIYSILSFYYAYAYLSRKRIRLVFFVPLLLVGSLMLSLIGMARGYDLESSFSERLLAASNNMNAEGRFEGKKSISPFTEELAFSYLSYEVMIKGMLKDNDGYRNGLYQMVVIPNSIPYGSGFIHKAFNLSRDQTSSSYYATYKYIGKDASWGLGTNCMGDFFMDFGWLGLIICMWIVGIFMRWVDEVIINRDKSTITALALSFALCYASEAIYMPRSNFAGLIKLCVFVIIIMWFASNHKKLKFV